MQPAGIEERLLVLMAMMNTGNTDFETVYVLPPIANRFTLRLSLDSKLLRSGMRLSGLSSFCEAVRSISRKRKAKIGRSGSKPKRWLSREARASIAASQRIRWEMWRDKKGERRSTS